MKPKFFSNFLLFKKRCLKSQIFMFDMILSIVIIILSLGIVLSYFVFTNENIDIYDYNYQILKGFTETKLNSLNDLGVRDMFITNQIKNIDNTVAQQVGEFYYTNNTGMAKNLTQIFVSNYVSNQMNFRISIYNSTNNYTLYEEIKNSNYNLEDASISSVTERTIFGYINKTNFYGPDRIRIEIWM